MSITAYQVEAVGHDRTAGDFGYVNIMYRYGGKQSCPRPISAKSWEVMWADESVYGPPAPGSKVGDFIMTWLMGSWNCGGIYPPRDCPAAHGYLYRPEGQGAGVVREPQGKDP